MMHPSSPLAALPAVPPFHGAWGCREEAQAFYPRIGGNLGLDAPSFNFKDLSMERVPTDYFTLKPVRGSSPTSSLAADLSRNFHIDQSPQLPTPRRSLFSSNLLGSLGRREPARTPPAPSSSPGPQMDSMEISPLPHKPPYTTATTFDAIHTEIASKDTSLDTEMGDSSPSELSRQGSYQQRRRHSLLRPSLSRTKGLSTSAVSSKPARMECPPFQFGSGLNGNHSMLMTPAECFEASPIRDGRPQSADSPSGKPMGPPPRSRQSSVNLRGNGLAGTGINRKVPNPMLRPRKQFRRSLSMFEHPEDVVKQHDFQLPSGGLDPVMDIDDPPRLQLPHFHSEDESIPRISKETMVDVLDGKYDTNYGRSLIVDCRFEYEFEGGHIDGAVNHNDKENLANFLMDQERAPDGRCLLIFHCEYSACRAPLMAQHVRGRDRAHNAHKYPHLTYPEIYILDGGYSAFFSAHKVRCSPQNYVEMGDKKHEQACERGMGRVKQQRTKLSRAQTFAFGEHEQNFQESPTGPCHSSQGFLNTMEIAMDSPVDLRRLQSRRLASF